MYPNVPPADQTTGSRAKPSALLEGSVSSPMTLFITPEKHGVNPGNRAVLYMAYQYFRLKDHKGIDCRSDDLGGLGLS